jgi:serine-type D-Ala-D-Ala carboxypeptidase (penicillin-binding protein 5/6)
MNCQSLPMPARRTLFAAAVCAFPLLAVTGFQAAAATTGSKQPAQISATAGELVNVKTGKDMWGREQAVQRPVASITKVMTALVVIRAGDLRRRIRITQADVDYVQYYGLSNAGLHAGDILTARALLYAMLLPSVPPPVTPPFAVGG